MKIKKIIPAFLCLACLFTACNKVEELDTSIYDSLETVVLTKATTAAESVVEGETTVSGDSETEAAPDASDIEEDIIGDTNIAIESEKAALDTTENAAVLTVSGTASFEYNKLIISTGELTYEFVLSENDNISSDSIIGGNYNATVTYEIDENGKLKILSFSAISQEGAEENNDA